MADASSSDSSIEAAAGAASSKALEAFEVLGGETRLAILLALWEATDPHGDERAVLSFSELRDRIGMRDSGQFNYHLDKLVGQFVYETGDGYALRNAGYTIVEAVIAGAGIEDPTLELTEIDVPCELCEAPTAITYRHELIEQVCTECQGLWERGGALAQQDDEFGGVLFATLFDPAGVTNRTPQEVYEAGIVASMLRTVMQTAGVCPQCSGWVETSLRVCEDHETDERDVCPNCGFRRPVRPQFICTVCKFYSTPSPSVLVGSHPTVIDFYADHGVDIGDLADPDHLRRMKSLIQEFELVSVDPPRAHVTVHYEGDELRLTLNEEMDVVEVSEDDRATGESRPD